MNQMVCDLCFPKAVEIGELVKDHFLMENEGQYSIIVAQGHKGHELLFFPDKPTPDPDPDCKSDDCSWLDKVLEWQETAKLDVVDGYYLVKACKESGYEYGDVLIWLYEKAGEMINEKSNQNTINE